jgi:hypothetical protein
MHLRVNTVADKLKWLNSLRKSQELIEKDTKIARRITLTRNKIIEKAGEELEKNPKLNGKVRTNEPIHRKIEDILQVHISIDDLIKELHQSIDPNNPLSNLTSNLQKETEKLMVI